MKKSLFLSAIIFVLCLFTTIESFASKQPKYIFYFIGDGFGINHAEITNRYSKKVHSKPLAMYSMPSIGIYTTYAANREITCSAAAGTALATGYKTNIDFIGVNPNKEPLTSIAEICRDNSMKVGIISSVSIDHATPASFYAKQPNRSMAFEISMDLSKSGFDYFAGGNFLKPEKNGVNSIEVAKNNGYKFINTIEEFNKIKNGDSKVIVNPSRLQSENSMFYAIDQTSEDITLVDFTKKAIEVLENPNGFFIMVEGGKIDWGAHSNDIATTIHEVIQFDNAVNEALEFYKKYPEETLIIVCADHETGGLSFGYSFTKYETNLPIISNQKISQEQFSLILEDYYKSTKNNPNFDDILTLSDAYFGFNKDFNLTDHELGMLIKAFDDSLNKNRLKSTREFYVNYAGYHPVAIAATRIIANRAGVSWTTFSHTAQPLPMRAIGKAADVFEGYYDNTDIVKKLKFILNK